MRRRKGERPRAMPLETWTRDHRVSNMVTTGSDGVEAWTMSKGTALVRPSISSGILGDRLASTGLRDRRSRAKAEAVIRARSVSPADRLTSMIDAECTSP